MSKHERENQREAGQDAALERAWRAGSAEQPAARVDAAILAAAHAAVAGGNPSRAGTPVGVVSRQRWSRWTPMAAAATVAGLAFMLVQTLPRDPGLPPAPAAQESAKATAAPTSLPAPASAGPDLAERQRMEVLPAGDRGSPVAKEQTDLADVMAAPALVPAPAAATPGESPTAGIAAASQVPSVVRDESRSDASARRGVAAEAMTTGEAASPEAWVTKILALHDAGDRAAAADMLRSFRAAVPDADRHLPETLREWAAAVR